MFPKCKLCALLLLLFVSCLAWSQAAPDTGTPAKQIETKSNLPDSTQLEIVKKVSAPYPSEAAQKGIQGQVVMMMYISETGDVENVDVISGEPILAEAAVPAAKKWKFKPYIKDGHPIKISTKVPFDFYFKDKLSESNAATEGTKSSLQPPSNGANSALTSNNASASNPGAPAAAQRVRVSQGVSEGLLIRKIAPVYPPVAKANRIQGTVVLRAVIGKDGRIADLRPISGPQELIQAAMGAVQQWQYKPYMLQEKPVEVDTQITINFQLR